MKKIISAVALTAAVVLTVSCEVESVSDSSISNKEFTVSNEIVEVQKADSIPQINFSSAVFGDNPGDEVLIIVPPKKLK